MNTEDRVATIICIACSALVSAATIYAAVTF